jgi:glycosyltransferase involved in cell wall biosynthesis
VKEKYQLRNPYLLFVGTVQPRKNLIKLIEAFAKAETKNTILVIAGKNGWLSEEIYQAPGKYSISEKVRFLGYIDDIDKNGLYTGATATILPSLFEGFGLPLLESMACGTPVIAANATSLPEVVGSAGLLIDPHDSDDIAEHINMLFNDQKLQQTLRQRGYDQVKNFTWQKAAQRTLRVLEKVSGHE